MDSKMIDAILPKFLEIAKTLNLSSGLISKIEDEVKSPSTSSTSNMSEVDKAKMEQDKSKAEDDAEDVAEGEDPNSEMCTCPKCGYKFDPEADDKPNASVSVAIVKKNPLKDLMSRSSM